MGTWEGSVAFNSSKEDTMCYTGNGKLYVRTGSFPVQEQASTVLVYNVVLTPCHAIHGWWEFDKFFKACDDRVIHVKHPLNNDCTRNRRLMD